MVGAGFSRNADPLPGNRKAFPMWRELARAMFDELNPPSGEPGDDRETLFNRMSPLRIASEFEAAFGTQKLAHLIRSAVPDSLYRPGELHKKLLKLPWVDVFTTNYDTLLERTEVDGRTYAAVTKVAELTAASSPRIVKLHGTLPTETPFIITEEDYRSYPRKFAPFVNSVQQSLLENAFALIGFSGDDPNFLAWSGWIRDEIGDCHAPIYLIGALTFTSAQRSLLGRRGVTPIDLTPLCKDVPDETIRQSIAIDRFLEILAAGRPQRPESWPEPHNRPTVHPVAQASGQKSRQLSKVGLFPRRFPGRLSFRSPSARASSGRPIQAGSLPPS